MAWATAPPWPTWDSLTSLSWQDPRLVWAVAFFAVFMLVGAWLLGRRRKGKKLNRGAVICGVISVMLHVLLIVLLPFTKREGGSGAIDDRRSDAGAVARVNVSAFSDLELSDSAASNADDSVGTAVPPLPVDAGMELITDAPEPEDPKDSETHEPELPSLEESPSLALPSDDQQPTIDDAIDSWLVDAMVAGDIANDPEPEIAEAVETEAANGEPNQNRTDVAAMTIPGTVGNTVQAPAPAAPAGRVVGHTAEDFAHRQGAARAIALERNGGDAQTEAAVQAAIAWLARLQGQDGGWDPHTSGAGIERNVLGQARGGAGARAKTGISGLALLSMLGAGQTHLQGEHAMRVRAGLQFLLTQQAPNGSLAGEADFYARTYSHGMASLAMCECAAMTDDNVAKESAAAAVNFTIRSQHGSTGGWRYVSGDPGDMSQLGWQAMVLASGHAAGVEIPNETLDKTRRFLRSVRAGRTGGLASYKPGERPSRTMTAEALAIRLLLGEKVPAAEVAEAESFLLEELPGQGEDNFYYWYYASLALHQLQSDAWRTWNARMKQRLLELQQPDGSWSTATTWGGYGGKVYTTSMACLCLEVYYRHLTLDEAGSVVAEAPGVIGERR